MKDEGLDNEHEIDGRSRAERFLEAEARPLSIVREIVLNMSLLMFSAIILIAVLLYWTGGLWSMEPVQFKRYSVFIIVPYVVLFGAVVAFFGGRLISKVVLKPLRTLMTATERVADGDLDIRVTVTENKEMAQLADSFNDMTRRLKKNRAELEESLEEMKRLNRNLAHTQRELLSSEKLASIGRLAAGVAHEIGNPLSSMAGYLEILGKRDYLQEKDREMVDRVQDEILRINEIIKELLDYARPHDDAVVKFDLKDTIQSTLTLLAGHKGFDGVALEVEMDTLPLLAGNRSSAKQLVMNLVINALQSMSDGGTLTVAARPVSRDGVSGIEMRVMDTGPGIPEEDLDNIFDPFFTTKEPGKGTGLGLSICERIVDNMGGSIEADNLPEGGAVFTVWLPGASLKE